MADGQGVSPGTRKVTVGSLGGATATVLVWFVSEAAPGVNITPAVTAALGTIATAIFVYMTHETYS